MGANTCACCARNEDDINLNKGALSYGQSDISLNNNRYTTGLEKPLLREGQNCPLHFSYTGQYESTIKEGFGIINWSNGSKFVGYFHNNIPTGWGVFTQVENGTFKGEYLNDQPNGYGMYKQLTDSWYEGYWKNEKQDGIGIEEQNDGSIYRGNFSQGKKHGMGQYIFPNKNIYYGYWEQNLMNGFGIYCYGNDQLYMGEWLNGLRDGYGEVIGPNKNYFFGFFRNNIQNGFFIYYNTVSTKIIVGYNTNGKMNGVIKYYKPNFEGKVMVVQNGHKIKEIDDENEIKNYINERIDTNKKVKDDNNLCKSIGIDIYKDDQEQIFNKYFFMNRKEIESIILKKIDSINKDQIYELIGKISRDNYCCI